MPYIAHLIQASEGCDYSIGCGCKIIRLKAKTSDAAVEELHQEIMANYRHDEFRLKSCVMYEVAAEESVSLHTIYDEIDNGGKRRAAQAALEKATRELELAKKQLALMG